MGVPFHDTLCVAVKVVNVIKARVVNSHLFLVMWEEVGSSHTSLLMRTHTRWLSRGRILTRLYELRDEVARFLSEMKCNMEDYFRDDVWLCQLAYLVDIFS